MNMENTDLMKKARMTLQGKWGEVLLASAIVQAVSFGFSGVLALLGSGKESISLSATALVCFVALIAFFVETPLDFGFVRYGLSAARREPLSFDRLLYGFSRWGAVIGATILISLFCMLWSVLLIVPGILAALSYSMTFYVMMDDENISPMDAIRKSKKMMYGHRLRFLCFCLRYIGWWLLAMLPYLIVLIICGEEHALLCNFLIYAGLVPVVAYFGVGTATFYDDLKASQNPGIPTP